MPTECIDVPVSLAVHTTPSGLVKTVFPPNTAVESPATHTCPFHATDAHVVGRSPVEGTKEKSPVGRLKRDFPPATDPAEPPITHFRPFHPSDCGDPINGIRMRFHVVVFELQYRHAVPLSWPTTTQMTPFQTTSWPMNVEGTDVAVHVVPSALVDTPPVPTATHFPPPHAIPMIDDGRFAGVEEVHVTLSVDFRIVDAVMDPAIHVVPFHAIDSAPPAVVALEVSVQFTPSGEVVTPVLAAAAQIVPFHAIIGMGMDPVVNPADEAFDQVEVGSDAYWI